MNRLVFAAFVILHGSNLPAQPLDLPPRPPSSPGGSELARTIASMPLEERERTVLNEIMAGNVPEFLRTLVPVTVEDGSNTLTYHVTADYLAVGSNDDYFLTPLTSTTAQTIADRLDCALPTSRMVDQIYQSAAVKLTPLPIPPSAAMTTVPVFLRHNEMIRDQHRERPLGALVAGHKKDIVIANSVVTTPGKVAIYGWHKPDGQAIQPLFAGHASTWADYSHGVRLVRRRLVVNGISMTLDQVLADPRLASLFSAEGVMKASRYPAVAEPPPLKAPPGETYEELRLDRGVRVVVNRPEEASSKPVLLVFYATPNGSTIEQTIGKAIAAGDDWHFDIQHIGAQTRFLRRRITDRNVVVAYLENDLKSWPSWRKAHGNAAIPALVDAVHARFPDPRTRLALSGHSGGGSLVFGYLTTVSAIPDDVERIACLDANYAYETELHRDKLTTWLKASDAHSLVVLAYNDSVALLDGKSFVSASGGTWGRSHQMVADLEPTFPLVRQFRDGLDRRTALDGRLTFLLKENPDRKILHTVQVERNGFIECLLSGTPHEGSGYIYLGDRAYAPLIR